MAALDGGLEAVSIHHDNSDGLHPEKDLKDEVLRQLIKVQHCQDVHSIFLLRNHQQVL
jgi:hypothetical protein